MALRVIAGSAGGIPLTCPRTANVRPTMEQVRGALFSSLASRVPSARVLDLFAGAGGLGIEALSRGASMVTFVERDRKTMNHVRTNLEKTNLLAGAELVCMDVFTFLKRPNASHPFDLIFADPPYTTSEQSVDYAAKLLSSADLVTQLASGGLFVLEKSPHHELSNFADGWKILRQKRYGTTELLFLERAK